jgi:hypothetical protein
MRRIRAVSCKIAASAGYQSEDEQELVTFMGNYINSHVLGKTNPPKRCDVEK